MYYYLEVWKKQIQTLDLLLKLHLYNVMNQLNLTSPPASKSKTEPPPVNDKPFHLRQRDAQPPSALSLEPNDQEGNVVRLLPPKDRESPEELTPPTEGNPVVEEEAAAEEPAAVEEEAAAEEAAAEEPAAVEEEAAADIAEFIRQAEALGDLQITDPELDPLDISAAGQVEALLEDEVEALEDEVEVLQGQLEEAQGEVEHAMIAKRHAEHETAII